MYKLKRITRHYLLEGRGETILVTHTPKWLFYFANRERFFQERRIAYAKIASLLSDQSFWPERKSVKARSMTIDFLRETDKAMNDQPAFYDLFSLALVWGMNLYNWRFSRFKKLLKIIQKRSLSQIELNREEFIRIYWR